MLLSRGQHALKADHEEITDEMGVNVFWAAAHEFLFKARDPFADGGFDLPLGLGRDSRSISILARGAGWSSGRLSGQIRALAFELSLKPS